MSPFDRETQAEAAMYYSCVSGNAYMHWLRENGLSWYPWD